MFMQNEREIITCKGLSIKDVCSQKEEIVQCGQGSSSNADIQPFLIKKLIRRLWFIRMDKEEEGLETVRT